MRYEEPYGGDQWREHCEFTYSSDAEIDRYEAMLIAEQNPDRAWINSGRDVWYKNPFYNGPDVPHPEED